MVSQLEISGFRRRPLRSVHSPVLVLLLLLQEEEEKQEPVRIRGVNSKKILQIIKSQAVFSSRSNIMYPDVCHPGQDEVMAEKKYLRFPLVRIQTIGLTLNKLRPDFEQTS